ncbi:hypothetical protein Xen7305DRAFT_00020400 [Xenococcus sp. PCC 7305]|nr:hypothetical protein Xen7305DRAFT_00020400 [Xenococcus sp. PCC 7305]
MSYYNMKPTFEVDTVTPWRQELLKLKYIEFALLSILNDFY